MPSWRASTVFLGRAGVPTGKSFPDTILTHETCRGSLPNVRLTAWNTSAIVYATQVQVLLLPVPGQQFGVPLDLLGCIFGLTV